MQGEHINYGGQTGRSKSAKQPSAEALDSCKACVMRYHSKHVHRF